MKKRYIKWLWNISVGMRKGIIMPLILNFFAVMLSLLFVEITRILMEVEYEGTKCLLLYIILLVVVKLIQIAFEQGEMYIREITSAKMDNALSLRTIKSIFSCNIYDEQKIHSGDEMSRITVDVSMVAQLITYTLPFMLYASVQLIATSVYLLFVQPSLTLIILSIMPFVLIVGKFYTEKMVPISIDIRTNDSNIKQYVQEHLQHYELINTLGQTHSVLSTIRKFQSALYVQLKSRAKVNVVSETTIDIGFVLGFLSIFIWGIYGINNHTFTYAQLVVFMQLIGQLQRPFVLFKEQYPTLVSSYASIDRLLAIDDMPHENLSEPTVINGSIGLSFSNVSYRYGNESDWIYKDFSYEFVPGSTTAVLGPTGSGKSTLFKLILSIVNPTSGTIHIYNNNNEKHIVKASTRCNCIYVPQGNNIISGTIRYNLLLGKDNATEEEMFNALYTATAEFVFSEFPNGLDTKVGEGGFGISEGQAQRISIARALLQSGGLLLLDEPTSALDPETERIFMERIISNSKKTIIIITHRTEISRYVSNVLTIKRKDMHD